MAGSRRPFWAVILLVTVWSVAHAQTEQTPSAPTDLLDATCGQYTAAIQSADPGANPSRERRAEAEDAQDALVA
jgi:hypothetical protein